MTTQEHEQTRAAWDKIAAGYDEFVTATHMELGNEGLRRAGLRPGMRFLDVAAGSGALSIPAARLGAQVLATDQSPVMLERLSARARNEGLDVETRVMDGHALELDDDSFEMAGSQFGVMLFPDMPKGIREMARVVRARRPCADERVRRPAQDRVLRILRARHPVRPTRLRGSPDGSAAAPLPAAGSKEVAQRAHHRRTEGRQGRGHHRDHGVPDRQGIVGLAGIEQSDRGNGARWRWT